MEAQLKSLYIIKDANNIYTVTYRLPTGEMRTVRYGTLTTLLGFIEDYYEPTTKQHGKSVSK